MRFVDAHTHVNFAAFKDDYREVIQRAHAAGVVLVNVGTQKDTSQRAVEIAHEFEDAYAAVGVHPIHTSRSHHDADELDAPRTNAEIGQRSSASSQRESAPRGFMSRAEEFDYKFYKKLASDAKVVAIGECGLDYYRLRALNGVSQIDIQKEVFVRHIELSHAVQKPLMIHCREAFSDLITILKAHDRLLNDPPGIAHFFSGTKAEARELLDMGFYFTFGGVVTFTSDYNEAVRYIPADRILSETDAPYVAPAPYRGKRNEPLYVLETVKTLAELKGLSVREMQERIWLNAREVFGME